MPCIPKHTVRDVNSIAEGLPIPFHPATSPVEPVALTVDPFIKRISAFGTINFVHVWIIFFREFFDHRTFRKIISFYFQCILCPLPEFWRHNGFMVILDIPRIHFSPISDQFSFFIYKILMHDIIAFVNFIFQNTKHRTVKPFCTTHRLHIIFIQVTLNSCQSISLCCHFINFSYPYRFLFICNIDTSLILLKSERPFKILHGYSRLVFSLVHHLCPNASTLTFCLCECCKDGKHKFSLP